jgi:hypothetical protein
VIVSVILLVEVPKYIGLVIICVAVSDGKLFDCDQVIMYLIKVRLNGLF